ncbi:MAG TPA: glycoside hydrolase family 2 TIM barrel-domain containing protein [Allosphingosinicella sp.]|jgi:beta-glucuronidase
MKALLALLLVSLATPGSAAPVLVAGDIRPAQDLTGPWHWSADPYRDGVAGFHGEEPGLGHRRYADVDVEAEMAKHPNALFEFDMARSPIATLPSSWINHDPTMRHYDGLVWYQRGFEAQPRAGRRYFLRFGAAEYRADVFVNGKRVGSHEGGFTPFAFEVTGLLRAGANQVTVGVDSQRSDATVPPTVTDWETYGGLTRPVRLIEVPATYVDDAWIRLTRDGHIRASGRLDGPAAAGAEVRVRVAGLLLTARSAADGSWSVEAAAPRTLKRWSPDSPTLYDVIVEAGEDRLTDRIGFRTIAVRGRQILLNGKPIFLRGISVHEEELGADPTRAMTPAAARALLAEVKTGLHGNFVRLAHYPHAEAMTRAADEMGLIVWSEIPVYWRVAFGRPETLALARTMLAENILRDRNRAAIALWSVGNETPVGADRNAFLAALAGDVRKLDDTRLVTAALLTRREQRDGHPVMVLDDPLAASLDVLAVNTYNGWYTDDRLADLPAIGWRVNEDKPLILSELGADAKAGFHDPATLRKYSEEFQAEYYRQTLAMAAKIPFLAGMSPWILKDFRSPRRQHPVFQQGWNRKGLISETGQRKLAFDVLAGFYREIEAEGR